MYSQVSPIEDESPLELFFSRSVEQCHYTYVTKFKAAQEEICDENYEKVCQISYSSKAVNDTIKKCYRPVQKVSPALFRL